ncbi:hypothetical protein OPV22_008538 [Ensete ventricosum]|uniref:ELYS-like domain-containing protein n=1 Tax=Ensete ventricosum TaxID=4639 RepID=A0AAV8R6U9_ENSVE|nr:hypothetical protein OPV22_008538 [Ensete ventricosum]
MESIRSERSPTSEIGDGRRSGWLSADRPPPNYASAAVQDALEHLASIDLLELCNEAKVEHCRATRDLSSCGRCVQHVLNSCGHASLCEECSKRCDVCPICRTLIPSDGCRLHLRLYYKCIEVGLISKQHDDRSQEREVSQKHMTVHIERLYSLFDVALKNNLVSLICHYITDVCMNENAVSSDPVFAFLLDEVVVKDWCKETFKNIVSDLCEIYSRGTEAMRSRVSLMQKFALHLSGLSNVLEVMTSSFKETFAAQVHDLHHLLENVLKAKQHLEVMIWCTRHQFLRDVQSRFYNLGNSEAWNLDVYERKSAAIKRSWPQCSSNLVDSARPHDNTLFIEDALSNLGIEESYVQTGVEVDISCLQDDSSGLLFLSKIDIAGGNGYPFRNLRAAADILFLRGTSDMVVAKQAIFLYYLFDRHWKRPDAEWKHIVDDFAVSFGIATHTVQESLVFYLLDDHTPQALQEAINLLPEVAGPEIHPKIAQVLLERQHADVALSILRCSGRDGGLSNINTDNDFSQHDLIKIKVSGSGGNGLICLQRRINPQELDNEALAFRPVLGSMLARIYNNPHNKDANQPRLEKILHFWVSKEVYDQETIMSLEREMTGGLPFRSAAQKELIAGSDPSSFTGVTAHQWPDKQNSDLGSLGQQDTNKQFPPTSALPFAPTVSQQLTMNQLPPAAQTTLSGTLPIQPPIAHLQPNAAPSTTDQAPPPYPLFPPGLIPGMVRKMQIGSGVPYSPLSPLDIPTVIPPSTAPPSETLDRVSKFFKEIGEVNPSEGPMRQSGSKDEYPGYERESPVRKGGACIPPPVNLQLDPETGAYADGSVDRSSSGRLGLGATANPNEVSQYDDVYTSYRKQRSTSYHSSMSAKAGTR